MFSVLDLLWGANFCCWLRLVLLEVLCTSWISCLENLLIHQSMDMPELLDDSDDDSDDEMPPLMDADVDNGDTTSYHKTCTGAASWKIVTKSNWTERRQQKIWTWWLVIAWKNKNDVRRFNVYVAHTYPTRKWSSCITNSFGTTFFTSVNTLRCVISKIAYNTHLRPRSKNQKKENRFRRSVVPGMFRNVSNLQPVKTSI